MRLGILLLASSLLASPDDGVDPALVGSWQTVLKNEHGEWTLTFQLEASGAYRTTIQGPTALPDETGKFTGTNGKWSTAKSNGTSDGGTYKLAGDSLSFTTAGGMLVWKRVGAAPKATPPETPPLIAGT